LKERFYLKEDFTEKVLAEIEVYRKKILFWQKLGIISVWLSVIGALVSLLFIIF